MGEDDTVYGEYSYDAWGNCTIVTDKSGIATLNPFRYRGYYYDEETGLYYLQTRYYDPTIGRFISPDSVDYLDPESINGLNLYIYCLNNPVMYIDPTGYFPLLALILGLVAVTGLGLTIGGVASGNNIVTAVGLTMTTASALISGGIALIGGALTGATLTSVVGALTVLAGVGTGLFASAEYQQGINGNNWLLNLGLSEDVYYRLMISVATIATMGTMLSSFSYGFNIRTINGMGRFSKYGQKGYWGIRFINGQGKVRVLTFHTHSHVAGKTISQWHWQLQKWNGVTKEVAGTIAKWIWWNLRRF